jgi:hypothetical protein
MNIAAGSILFQFATYPQFQQRKDATDGCRVLLRLCHLGSTTHAAISHRCLIMLNQNMDGFNPQWLETASSLGSIHASESLRDHFGDRYIRLQQSNNDSGFISDDPEGQEDLLYLYCRSGNYEGCKALLAAGTYAVPKDGMPSPLHWIVSFTKEEEINDLVPHLLENGAVLEAGEGGGDDFLFGKVFGTPLHWAVRHRNIFAVQALTRADYQPDDDNVNRAVWLAAAMHFYDVLEVLKIWVVGLRDSLPSKYNWYIAIGMAT